MRTTTEFDLKLAESYLNYLLDKHKIKIDKFSKTCCGWAIIEKRLIKVPKIIDIHTFCVSMHEIGHIVKNASKQYMKLYQSEFIAEMYAIAQCKLLNFDFTEYRERARRYIVMCVSKGYRRKLNLDKLDDEIVKFCNIDFNEWKNKKVFVYNWGFTNLDKDLKIIYYND